jgi:hypothetical protein
MKPREDDPLGIHAPVNNPGLRPDVSASPVSVLRKIKFPILGISLRMPSSHIAAFAAAFGGLVWHEKGRPKDGPSGELVRTEHSRRCAGRQARRQVTGRSLRLVAVVTPLAPEGQPQQLTALARLRRQLPPNGRDHRMGTVPAYNYCIFCASYSGTLIGSPASGSSIATGPLRMLWSRFSRPVNCSQAAISSASSSAAATTGTAVTGAGEREQIGAAHPCRWLGLLLDLIHRAVARLPSGGSGTLRPDDRQRQRNGETGALRARRAVRKQRTCWHSVDFARRRRGASSRGGPMMLRLSRISGGMGCGAAGGGGSVSAIGGADQAGSGVGSAAASAAACAAITPRRARCSAGISFSSATNPWQLSSASGSDAR